MTMKLSKRDIGLLLGLVGIVMLALVYRLVFVRLGSKTEAIQTQIEELSRTEDELVALEQKMPEYQEGIKTMNVENGELMSHFPAEIKPENEIMYGVELEDENEVFFTELNYGSPSVMNLSSQQQAAPTVDPETGEEIPATPAAPAIEAYELVMTMGYEATYQGLKDVITHTREKNERMVIDGVTAAFDPTTGQLTGTLNLNQYYIVGSETGYQAPYVPNMRMGVKNIFGTNSGDPQVQAGAEAKR